MASPPLLFAVNGERVQLEKVDPSTTLNEYLRLHSKYKGTKLSCGEGMLRLSVALILDQSFQAKHVCFYDSRRVATASVESCYDDCFVKGHHC